MWFHDVDLAEVSRRQTLGLGAGLSGAALMAAPAFSMERFRNEGAANSLNLDFAKPEDNLRAWIKMVSSLEDGKETCGYFKGTVYSVIGQDNANTPLFGYEGFGMSRVTKQEDGRYENLHREVAYYTELRTGRIMEEWNNPMIDETVKVYPVHNDPVNSYYAPIFKQSFGDPENPNIVEFPFILPWTIVGDWAFTEFAVNTRWPTILDKETWPREHGGPWVRVGEYLQLHAKLSELNDPKLDKVETSGAWTRVGTWLPWMLMAERQGHLLYVTHTLSLKSTADLPKKIREYTEMNYPKFMHAPEKWTEPNVTSFEVYKNEATPAPVKG